MFNSTFSKYLTAFIVIIFVSFAALSGIITSMIRGYATEDHEKDLLSKSEALVAHIESKNVVDLENHTIILQMVVSPIIYSEKTLDILIINASGKVLLSTINAGKDADGNRIPSIYEELGTVDIDGFERIADKENGEYLFRRGKLENISEEAYLIYAKPIIVEEKVSGYVLAMNSTTAEDKLISITRRAVINSSVWVMLAAIIAIYFITERITHPLKKMTEASKTFAKGDFSVRVPVYGEDEVSKLAIAFNNMAQSLDNLESMRNSFLASISHDLRTPMTTISGFIEGITSGAIPPEKHDYYLGVISAEVHRLSRLVSQLLDVSRLESGDRKFVFTNFDVAEVSRIILISFEQKIDDKKLDVEFYSQFDKMPVNADKDAIYQVIYNLCHNAIKFASAGGKFKISIKYIDNKTIGVSVFDEGQIISSEDLPMVFERFYKTDKSRGLDKHGVGLGLYICKTIIDAHEQKICVVSKEGIGTEFYFTLRACDNIKRRMANEEQSDTSL